MSDPPDHASNGSRATLARVALGQSTRLLHAHDPHDSPWLLRDDDDGGLELDLDDPAQRDFGDYVLRERIGRGGMGVVFRAHQRSLDREVAIKLLLDGAWASPDFIDALGREARSAARLRHPGIVTVYDIGEHGDLVYYAMALVDGESLAQRIAREGALPPRDAAACLRTVAEAVDYAHRLGVLHLDLKPSNVIIGSDGLPQVADFGLARRVDRQQAVADNSIAGTPGYMAPEQLSPGRVLGPAADVWGLGATLYEALTGHAPFERRGMRSLEAVRQRGIVRNPRRYRPRLPRDLEAICLKCLQEDPAQRYSSARALADDLGRYLEGRQVTVRPLGVILRTLRWARRERRLAAISALAVASLVGGLVATNLQRRMAEDSAALARENLWAQRHETAWRLLEEGRDYQVLPLLARNLDEQVRAGAGRAATLERLRLHLVQAQVPALLAAIDVGAPVHALALSDDGTLVALGLGRDEVALYSTRTHERLWQVALAVGDPTDEDHQLRHLRFTPGGRWLLVTEHAPLAYGLPGAATYRLALADGRQTPVPDGQRGATYQAWRDDGQQVLFSDRRSWIQLFEGAALRPVAPKRRLDVPWHHDWAIAPGGAFVAMIDGSRGLRILDPVTLATRHALATGGDDAGISAWAISTDARHVAIGQATGEVLLLDPVSGEHRLLFPGEARPAWLSFSEDGTRLAASFADGDFLVLGLADGAVLGRIRRDSPLWGHQFDCMRDPLQPQPTCLALLMQFDRITLWSLPESARPAALPARASLLAPEISHPSYLPRFASMVNRSHGLLATGGQDGSLRLWRLPQSPALPAPAPTLQESPLAFDGRHVVGVDGPRLRVLDARTGAPLSPPMQVPTAIGFAVLAGDGRSLVASSGHELHVFDWRRGRLRFPPIALGGSPTHLMLAVDGSTLVARWLAASASDRMGVLRAYSLADGQPLGPAVPRPFAAAQVIDGGRLLLDEKDAASLFALGDLRHPLLRFPAPPGMQSRLVAYAPGRDAFVQYLESPLALENNLRRWSLRDGRLLAAQPLAARAFDLRLRARDGRLALSGNPGFTAMTDVALLLDVGGGSQAIDTPRGTRLVHAQAYSADGAVLAQAVSSGVMLIDADSGRPVGPVIKHWLPGPDEISQLAFSPDARQLLARTRLGRWLHWDLAIDDRSPALVAAEGALVSPANGSRFAPPDEEIRTMLRARSRPPPRPVATLPFSGWSCLPPDARAPGPGAVAANTVDLGGLYATSLHYPVEVGRVDSWTLGLRNRCWIPPGRQRLLGVDYELRGVVELRSRDTVLPPGASSRPETTGPITVPHGRYAAAHVLSTLGELMLVPQGPVAEFTFHYRTGPVAAVPMHSAPSPTYPLGDRYVLPSGLRTALASDGGDALFASELRNPHPERELVAVELRATAPLSRPWGVAVLAITLEPTAPH